MRISESGLYRNSTAFLISALIHSVAIYWIFFHNPFKMKMGDENELVSINLDVFAPIQAPNFAEELVASAASSQLVSQTQQTESVEEEKVEEEVKEEVKEEKPIPEIEKPKAVEKVNKKPKKQTKKPQEKAQNLAATAQKHSPDMNVAGSGMGKANADGAPIIGEFNMQKSKGDPNFRKIIAAIQKYKFYPRAAERMRKKGKVTVYFMVHKNGTISSLRIVKGCGHEVLDKGAIETVKRAAKEFPKLNQDYHVTVPISYDTKA